MGTGLEGAILIAALTNGVDPSLLSAVCYVESSHNPSAFVRQDGRTSSYGLCQVKLETARTLGYAGKASGLMDARTNAYFAAKYLRKQYNRYGSWTRAVSAYNCGRVCNNRRYVRKVIRRVYEQRRFH
jgi:soluble lytic murein transglycosylase-like protein